MIVVGVGISTWAVADGATDGAGEAVRSSVTPVLGEVAVTPGSPAGAPFKDTLCHCQREPSTTSTTEITA